MLSNTNLGNGTLKGVDVDKLKAVAINEFAEKGYLAASLEHIAEVAGCTEEQILSIYTNKELFFTQLVIELTDTDTLIESCGTVLEMFVALVEDIKQEILEETGRAKFLDMLIHSRENPEICKVTYLDRLKNSKLYPAVEKARLHGIIIGTDSISIIRLFLKTSFSIIYAYKQSGMKIPDNEWFLSILHFEEEDKPNDLADIIKKQNSVIAAFAADFQSILFVDLDNDHIDVYQANGENDSWIMATAGKGYMEFRRRFSERFLFPEDYEWFMKETDPESIKERLSEDPVLYIDHRVISRGEPYYYQTIVVLDPMYSFGNRVLIGGHRVYEDRRLERAGK